MILTAQGMFKVVNWACDKFKERCPLEYQQLRDMNQFEWYIDINHSVICMMLDGLIVMKVEGKDAIVLTGDTYNEYKVLKPIFYKETYIEPLEPYACINRRQTDHRSNLELLQFILQNHDITLNDQELSFAVLYRKYQKENPRR